MVSIIKALEGSVRKSTNYVPAANSGGWLSGWSIKEPFSGAWQRNIEWERQDVLCYFAVFACITLIASDISKLRVKMVRKDSDGIWNEIPMGKYSVIDKPNEYQNRIQFFESWVLSKYMRGNTYVFKEKNNRGEVIGLHVLHPDRVLPMVTEDGDVFYQLSQDNLGGITQTGITVPASEIIHDRFNCFYHPLVGLSPLFAAGLPAFMGKKALENSAKLFANGSRPSGILTIPEAISKERSLELSEQWEQKYGGENYGKTAILGGDLKYTALSMKAEEAQVVEQMKMTAEMVASTFHVPPYKIGIGQMPSHSNVEALNLEYYNSALHSPIESIELCLDDGLGIQEGQGIEFDIDGLLRMDSRSHVEMLTKAVSGSIMPVNEALKRMNIHPVEGGEYIWMQQQNYSLQALAERDRNNPFEKEVAAPQLPPPDPEPEETEEMKAIKLLMAIEKELNNA